ncbi:hypothetical protein ILUMI_05480 [Ignelater luminosus]|uniref:Uncharacterized protein n=1 Tax=Ignelater luminosus TaxID=2038154 RepID=A0A8K0GIM3_IGNLU|nr:hypothetical protein ILUMI_05480 [Ignelater luminosus]
MVFGVTVAIIKRVRTSDPHDWEFPYGPITIINVTYSPNFEIILAWQVSNMALYAGYFCATDLTTAAILAHISYQFKMLQHYIRNVVKLTYKKMLKESNMIENEVTNFDASLIPWQYLKSSLTRIVEYHLAIINIAQQLEDVFSGLLLIVFVSTLAMVALMIYRVSLV